MELASEGLSVNTSTVHE